MAVDPKQYCSKTVMKSKENAAKHNQEEEQIDTKEDHQLDGNSERNFCPQIDTRLIPSKLFYFLYFSSLGALVPYLALYFKQMKLTPSQVGILMGLKPFVEFIFTPLWGALVDRFKTGKAVLLLSLFVTALSQSSLFLVAPAERICAMRLVSRATELPSNTSSILPQHNGNISSYWKNFVFVSSVVNGKPWPLVYMSEEETSSSTSPQEHFNTLKAFTILFIVILLSNIFSSPSLALADLITMKTLKPNVHLYGRQRLWGSVGWGVTSFVVGALVTLSHHCPNPFTKPSEVNFMPCFCTFGVLMLSALLTSTKFEFSYDTKDKKGENKHNGIINSLKKNLNLKYVIFLVTVFYFGILNAFTKTFLFWYLKDLGGTQLLFSVITAVNCFAEVSMFVISDRIISRLGHTSVLFIATGGFALRCLWYSCLTNPWHVLPIEFMPGITNALAWVAMMSYVNEISTIDNATTHQGILYAFYRGLGYGCGEVLGGVMINFVGSANAFEAYATGAVCILFGNVLVENIDQLKQFLQVPRVIS